MITAASDHKDLAHQLIEYLVEAKTQKQVGAVTGYLPANPAVAALLTAGEKKNLHLDDLDHFQQRIYCWEDVPRRDKYNQIWNEVKAAVRLPRSKYAADNGRDRPGAGSSS